MLLLAPLALLPIGLHLAAIASAVALPNRIWRVVTAVQLPAALFLGFAYLLPQGVPSASLSLPWLITTGLIAWCGLHRLWKRGLRPLDEVCLDFGLIFVVVGGAWVVSDRLGFRLLDFETVIVLLTAIHFHYAGFILPIVTGLAARQIGGLPAKLAGVGVISGVLSWPSVLQQLSSSWVR